MLITDLMDKQGYEAAFRYLVSQQMDVYVIQVLSAEELDPDVKGDLKLVDCEDEDVAEITASAPLLKRYKQTLASFVDGARTFCTRRGMGYLLASNQLPVQDLVGSYLRPRTVGKPPAGRRPRTAPANVGRHELHPDAFLVAVGRAGGGAAGDHAAVLSEAQAATARGAEHLSLAPLDRGFARQQHLAAAAAKPAATAAIADRGVGHSGPAAARLAGYEAARQPLDFSGR